MRTILASVGVIGMVVGAAVIGLAQQRGATKAFDLVFPGGALGPHLREASRSCKDLMAAAKVAAPPSAGEPNPCGLNRGLGRIEGHGMTIDDLAGMIGSPNGLTVTNKTGLSGFYDFEVKYTPDNLRNHAPDKFKDVDPAGPTIFTAVEQQLGLRLVAR